MTSSARKQSTAVRTARNDEHSDRLVKQRLTALGYYSENDDQGGGNALEAITNAAATLGSAYIATQNQPQYVQVPQRTYPAYGAATSGGGGMLLILGGILIVGVLFLRG